MPPLGFFVYRFIGYGTQGAYRATVDADSRRRNSCASRLVHEGHELVRGSRHRATDANSTNVRANTNPGHRYSLGHVAVDGRAPTAEFHNALGRTVLGCKIPLFVVAGWIATLMHGLAKKPSGTQLVIEGNHGRESSDLIKEIEEGFHEIVRLNGTTWNVHHRQASA